MAALFGPGCSGDGTELTVDLRTDFHPATNFVSVRTELLTAVAGGTESAITRVTTVSRTDAFLRGQHVATFGFEPPLDARVRLSLLDAAGTPFVSRTTVVRASASLVITVLITQDCRGVVCPGADDDRQNAVHEMRGARGHPPSRAARAQPSLLSRKSVTVQAPATRGAG